MLHGSCRNVRDGKEGQTIIIYKHFVKPVFDFIFALILMIPILPVILIAALLIHLEDGGKPFYNSPRLGKNGRIFIMYKLRTMKENAPDIRNEDLTTYNSKNDPRLTKIGKFLRETSIDETPQIFNILKGDMSFIGPRPDLPPAFKRYTEEEKKRVLVRPGITGYTQAFHRNALAFEVRNQVNNYYVENISFRLDAEILFKTISSILRLKSVYRNGRGRDERNERRPWK
ncbi:sugar transferase [Desulforamulus aeronauticus]|uniref:Sugar transferase involved in LPS biosynthesis (Colanic, teichoic acid) n=1 Tax=Desulforamulus aeronauticus DSM 10349 TaxID=1121421 RepID=A0A1M6V4D3_9FIRM|nr:sugar transferase [Desulforamulus aeronauticus]SHK76357.1 Sugar transferase involved in LPS biosynthesis (colanic, teichoic acid) [Desulforamulus aeronauticus DSM 10349]